MKDVTFDRLEAEYCQLVRATGAVPSPTRAIRYAELKCKLYEAEESLEPMRQALRDMLDDAGAEAIVH